MGWMFTSCSFLLNGSLVAWEWSRSKASEWHVCKGHRLLISRQHRLPAIDINLQLRLLEGGPKEVVVAVASTDSPSEILAAILDRRVKHMRGPPPLTEVVVRAFWVRLCDEPAAARNKTFFANGKACRSDRQLPALSEIDGKLFTLAVGANVIRACVHSKVVGKAHTREASSFGGNFYRVAVIVQGEEEPKLRVRPFLSRTKV